MSIPDKPKPPGNYTTPFSPDALNFTPQLIDTKLFEIQLEATSYDPALSEWSFPDVFSPFWRLYYNQQSGKSIHIGSTQYQLQSKALLLVPPYLMFTCQSQRTTDHLWIHFRLAPQWRSQYSDPIEVPVTPALETLIQPMQIDPLVEPTPEKHTARYLHCQALLASVISGLTAPEQSKMPTLVQAALDSIHDAPGQIESIQALAQQLHTSERNLRRVFTLHVGIAPAAYLMGCRLRQACTLLKDPDLSIEQIAEECGFADRFHFSKSFRQKLNLTPVEYRKTSIVHI